MSFFAAACAAAPKGLAIENASLHQYEDGPMLAESYEFVPGETLHLSFHVAGFEIHKTDEQGTIQLTWKAQALDPAGVPIDKEQSGKMATTVAPQDKDWSPKFLATFMVPAFAPSGTYRIPVTVRDDVAGKQATAEVTFLVRGHAVEPSGSLAARNFEFIRGENDKVAMHPAIYHQGDMLWARFDITGFKFGDQNRFSVDYGLAIQNSSGEQMFSQLVAAEESKQSFYPQRYVPGLLSLSLDKNVPKGSYTLVVIIRDKITNEKVETREPFEVQ